MSDEKCIFYKIHHHSPVSNEVGYGGQITTIVMNEISYCSHMDAPQELSRECLKKIIGGANELKCGGNEDKCQLKDIFLKKYGHN